MFYEYMDLRIQQSSDFETIENMNFNEQNRIVRTAITNKISVV